MTTIWYGNSYFNSENGGSWLCPGAAHIRNTKERGICQNWGIVSGKLGGAADSKLILNIEQDFGSWWGAFPMKCVWNYKLFRRALRCPRLRSSLPGKGVVEDGSGSRHESPMSLRKFELTLGMRRNHWKDLITDPLKEASLAVHASEIWSRWGLSLIQLSSISCGNTSQYRWCVLDMAVGRGGAT